MTFLIILPLMLQFLQVAEWRNDPRAEENIQLIIMIIEDGTCDGECTW